MLEKLKNALAVIITTALVWWAADRQVTDGETVRLRIAVTSADPAFQVAVESPDPADIEATVTGTRGRLAALRGALQQPGMVFSHSLAADDLAPGLRRMRARDIIQGSETFRRLGVHLDDAVPAEVDLRIDRFEDIALRVEPDFGALKVTEWACIPAEVTLLRAPGAAVRARCPDGVLRPPAEAIIREWLATHPNEPRFEIDLPLSIGGMAADLEFKPSSRVRVSGVFVDLFEAVRKGPVQIVFAMPPDVVAAYSVKAAATSDLRPDVLVRGPKNLVDQLAPEQIYAYVSVLASDASGGPGAVIRRAPTIHLPPGIELDREPQPIEFELVERAGVPPANGP